MSASVETGETETGETETGETETGEAFDIASYLRGAYDGEVLGEALFGLLAAREREEERAATWHALERLERHVKERLAAELERRGLDAREDRARAAEGRTLAARLGALPDADFWPALLAGLRDFCAQLETAAAQASAEDAPVARFVLEHEQALLAFAERASRDKPDALEPIQAFLARTGAEPDRPLPVGVALSPLDDGFRDDPVPVLRELQRRAPAHRDRVFGRLVLTRHDDVERVLRDPSFWVDARKADPDSFMNKIARARAEEEREPSMLGLDDPEHKRLRNLVSRAFTPRAVKSWEPVVAEVARDLVEAVAASAEPEFDLIETLASPLPAIAIARLLGVDETQQADFKAWSEAAVEAGFNPFATPEQQEEARKASAALDACFTREIARRRAEPADDLIGQMVAANEEGDRLTESEIVTMCNLLLVAGNVTTTDLIGNGVKALLEHPEQLARLRAEPSLLPNAIEEMLRYDPPVTNSGRLVPRDMEIAGVPLRQGESITTVLAAANRDPDVYPDPDRFDVAREDTHHQSFGGGAHLCLGAHLARLEAREAIAALLDRFPDLEAADRPFVYKRVPGFRGLAEYWLRRS